ncbi:6-O-methylguanine DNA methyltransferase, DNA binding domain protein [Aeromicrobium marinum DSM 15272]|uniref:6-O-methylguanine DNA methyltransferase, DNA binding domain protein n=1 Tax=Aeromicrobium marinum DSM 15272 TaxID=585531 RepID=E2SEA4_9ACTN|nr:MGMT family protein [Aeromicrobium marinum]EFQ82831.1 6-O-methylguanine DNA methyltransferase, DNA binding domain protein [Aeromicrobium marinum DSM 15272]
MDGEFTEQVLAVVESIPVGRVLTYGLIADAVGRGGPRQVGGVMARDGEAVCWWRVVRADGSLPPHLMIEAQQRWKDEGTPVRRGRVDVARAVADHPVGGL